MLRARMFLGRFNGRTYTLARIFGRGRLFSAWLQLRYCATGSTGRYRIRI